MYSERLREIDWKAAVAAKKDWKDPYFPANQNSLLDNDIRDEPRHAKWANFVWKRPQDVYGDDGLTLYEEPGPSDIQQGALGDCYFLASLSAIAEYPGRI